MKNEAVILAGPPLSGKTTRASKEYENSLFLGFTYGAYFPKGSMAYVIGDWPRAEQVVAELAREDVKIEYKTIIIDDWVHAVKVAGDEEKVVTFVDDILDLGYEVVVIVEELRPYEN